MTQNNKKVLAHILACAPFFVAVIVGFFFRNEKSGLWFYIGFLIPLQV